MKKHITFILSMFVFTVLFLCSCNLLTREITPGDYKITAVEVTDEAASFHSAEQYEFIKTVQDNAELWDNQRLSFDGTYCKIYNLKYGDWIPSEQTINYGIEDKNLYLWNNSGWKQSWGEVISVSKNEFVLKYNGIIYNYCLMSEDITVTAVPVSYITGPAPTLIPVENNLPYIFKVNADDSSDYWDKSETRGKFSIKLDKYISYGTASVNVYIPYSEDVNGKYIFEWSISAGERYIEGQNKYIRNVDMGKEGVTVTLSVDYNLDQAVNEVTLTLKSHCKSNTEGSIAVYNLKIAENNGKTFTSENFAEEDLLLYEIVHNDEANFDSSVQIEYIRADIDTIKK